MSDEEQQESPRGGAAEEESGEYSNEEIEFSQNLFIRAMAELNKPFFLEGKVEEEIEYLILESAFEQVRLCTPSIIYYYKKIDTNLLFEWQIKLRSFDQNLFLRFQLPVELAVVFFKNVVRFIVLLSLLGILKQIVISYAKFNFRFVCVFNFDAYQVACIAYQNF